MDDRIEKEFLSAIDVATMRGITVKVNLYRVRRVRLNMSRIEETETLGILAAVVIHEAFHEPLDPDIAVLLAEALRTAAAWAKNRTTCPPLG